MVWEYTHNGPPALLPHKGHAFNHNIKCLNMATIALLGISAGHSLFALRSKIPYAKMKMQANMGVNANNNQIVLIFVINSNPKMYSISQWPPTITLCLLMESSVWFDTINLG